MEGLRFLAEVGDEQRGSVSQRPVAPESPTNLELPDPPALDTWDLEEQLRHVSRLLAGQKPAEACPSQTRLDQGQIAARGWHRAKSHRAEAGRRTTPGWGERLVGLVGSFSVWMGVSALTCGGILLTTAYLASRAELQTVGLPIAIGGALALVLGVMIQLEQVSTQPHSPVPPGRHRMDSRQPGVRGPNTHRPLHRRSEKAA